MLSRRFLLLLLSIPLFFLPSSCRKSAFKPLTPQEEEAVSKVLEWTTEGAVGSRGPLEIRFKQDWAADDEVGKEAPSSWLRIDPGVEGRLIWKDHRTLRMEISKDLDPKELYLAKLDLKAITGQKDLPDYRFWFAPAPRHVDLEPQSFAKAADGSWTLSVRVQFSSQPSGDSTGWFEVSQSQTKPAFKWNPSGAQDGAGVLEVSGIQRNGQQVDVVVPAKQAGLPEDEKIHFQIPSGEEPGILSATPWNGENRMGFEVFVSDALASVEEIQGFVKVGKTGKKLQLSVSGNMLRATFEPTFGETPLTIERGLPVQNGRRLAQEFSLTHQFKDLKPSLSWSGSGIILPTQGENKVHFETMNLGRMRVIVRRIRAENIPEHLADRTLEQTANEYGRRRLGEEVWNRVIQLGAKRNQSFSGTLDLGRILQTGPGLYSISLEPIREGMVYSCSDQPVAEKPRVIGEASDDDSEGSDESEGEDQSPDYESDGESDGYERESYNYADRENPCKASFWRYNGSQSATRNVLVSDLGLIATQDRDGRLSLTAHDLLSTDTWRGVEIEALSNNDRVLASGSTNGDGMLELTGASKAFVIHAKAKKGGIEHHGWLCLDEGEARNLSKFDVGGESNQGGVRIFLYGERGVWRPGDSLYLGAIVRGEDHKAIDRLPLKWILRDPRGKVVSTSVQRAAADGHFGWRTATRAEDPTGRWSVAVEAGPASQSMGLQVETVRPNRLKIEIPATEVTADKDVEIKSHWLSGGSASGLSGKVDVAFLPRSFNPKGLEGYTFTNPTEPNGREEESTAWEGTLDAAGSARFRINVPSDIGRNPMTVALRTRVFEQGGQPSIDRVTLPYWPCVRYTGVRIRTEWGTINKPLEVDLALADRAGKPVPGQNLHVEVYSNGKYWWWETGERFRSFLTRDATRKVADLRGKSGASVSFVPDSVGQYLVIVTDETTGHSAGTDVYVSANGQPMPMDSEESSPARLRLSVDKDTVEPGGKIELSFPGAMDGRALVQLMRGNRVLTSEWIKTKGEVVRWSAKATQEMMPGVYVQVTQVQKWPPSSDRPLRMWGVVPVAVIDPLSRLKPTLTLPERLQPETKVKVHLAEENKRPMQAMLMIVDEGLLDLTRFKTPHPWKAFHGKEPLEVKTWDMHDIVMAAWGGRSDRMFAVGGGGGEGAREKEAAKANPFRPMVVVVGPVEVPKGGKDIEVDIPRYTGSVRAMVVAVSQSAYGSAEKTVQVKSPVMALLTVPRGMSPGDRADVPVTIFSEKAGPVKVKITLDGPASIDGASTKTVQFAAPGDQVVTFSVKASGGTGQVGVHAVAEAAHGTAKVDEPLQVRLPGEPRALVQWGSPLAGQVWSVPFEAYGADGSRQARLELSSVGLVGMEQRLDELVHYPHGCLEQTISAALPQVFLGDLMPWADPARIKVANQNVDIAIDKLQRFQLPSGAFTLWPGEGAPYEWGTIWAGRFFLASKTAGHTVPVAMWDAYLRHLGEAVSRWSPGVYAHDRGDTLAQVVRLDILAQAGRADLGRMNVLRAAPMSDLPRWILAGAYASAGRKDVATQIAAKAGVSVSSARSLSSWLWSDVRDQAFILEAMVRMGENQRSATLASSLREQIRSSRWLSTQETGAMLWALSRWVGARGGAGNFQARWRIGGGEWKTVSGARGSISIDVPDKAQGPVEVENSGKGALEALFTRVGIDPPGTPPPAPNGLTLDVEYVDGDGAAVNPASLARGEDFVIKATVKNVTRDYLDNLALIQVFPGGWELRNEAMEGAQGVGKDAARRVEFRDDRVFHYFALGAGRSVTFQVGARASYSGTYLKPGAFVSAMYDGSLQAATGSSQAVVTP